MFPRHSRAHPFVIRIRSFAWTRSISSFHRLTETSEPSSSTAFASQTLPVDPGRFEKSRAAPFSRIVSSITSTLLSGRTSLTFIGNERRTLRSSLRISSWFRSSCVEDSGCASSGSDGRSSATLREPEILSTEEIKLITSAPDILGVDRLNRIKVVSEVAELVPILRAVDSDVKAEAFKEVSAGWMTVREIEAKFGAEGANAIRFFEKLKLVETKWPTGRTASADKAYHAVVRRRRHPRFDEGPRPRTVHPRRRPALRGRLPDSDRRPVAASRPGMVRVEGPPHDVRRTGRESGAARAHGRPPDRRRRRKSAPRNVRPGRLERRDRPPTPLRGRGPRGVPRPLVRWKRDPPRVLRPAAHPPQPERQGRPRV